MFLLKSIAGNSARTVVSQDDDALGDFGFRRPKDKDTDNDQRAVSYFNLDQEAQMVGVTPSSEAPTIFPDRLTPSLRPRLLC